MAAFAVRLRMKMSVKLTSSNQNHSVSSSTLDGTTMNSTRKTSRKMNLVGM